MSRTFDIFSVLHKILLCSQYSLRFFDSLCAERLRKCKQKGTEPGIKSEKSGGRERVLTPAALDGEAGQTE